MSVTDSPNFTTAFRLGEHDKLPLVQEVRTQILAILRRHHRCGLGFEACMPDILMEVAGLGLLALAALSKHDRDNIVALWKEETT